MFKNELTNVGRSAAPISGQIAGSKCHEVVHQDLCADSLPSAIGTGSIASVRRGIDHQWNLSGGGSRSMRPTDANRASGHIWRDGYGGWPRSHPAGCASSHRRASGRRNSHGGLDIQLRPQSAYAACPISPSPGDPGPEPCSSASFTLLPLTVSCFSSCCANVLRAARWFFSSI
jgi:hypothetical protein